MTARRVAAQRLSFTRVPASYGRPDDDQRLQADVAAGIDVTPTPMTRYLQARTSFFDSVITRSIERGVDQIVAVGAGYDGRSLRYAKPGVRWFELDHPDTQADKRARLDRLAVDAGEVAFAAADFGVDDVAGALRGAGHDAERETLFCCEGVAGYLPLDTLAGLLASLGRVAADGSRLAITISLVADSDAAKAQRSRLTTAVAGMGEPLASAIPRADLTGFLAATGWDTKTATDPAGMAVDESDRSAAFVIASAQHSPASRLAATVAPTS
jgi:methyltransferase (TIGR00027 family)